MLQQPEPDDYVLATGETHSVREFVELAFARDRAPDRLARQRGGREGRRRQDTGEVLVEVDPAYFRPTEVDLLLGDPTKAREKLGWTHKTSFRDLVKEMVASDLVEVEREYRRYDRHGLTTASRASACGSPAIAAWRAARSCAGSQARTASS